VAMAFGTDEADYFNNDCY